MTHHEPVAGIHLPPELFAAALLGALIRQEGGTVTVSEEVYRREANRIKQGLRSQLSVDVGPEGHFIVRISEAPGARPSN